MSLHNGLDTVSIISYGVYTKTYGSTEQKYVNNLYSSFGLFEDAPDILLLVFRGLSKLGLSMTLG